MKIRGKKQTTDNNTLKHNPQKEIDPVMIPGVFLHFSVQSRKQHLSEIRKQHSLSRTRAVQFVCHNVTI